NADARALAELLREDVALEMPPMTAWFAGREAVTRFFETNVFTTPGLFRMVPTMANGQPAFAAYRRGRDGAYEAHALQVLTVTATGVARLVIFLDPALFRAFRLPQRYGAAGAAPPGGADRLGPWPRGPGRRGCWSTRSATRWPPPSWPPRSSCRGPRPAPSGTCGPCCSTSAIRSPC